MTYFCYTANVELNKGPWNGDKRLKHGQFSSDNEECKKAHNRVDGSVCKKIINFTNKPVLSRQIRVSYSAKWR